MKIYSLQIRDYLPLLNENLLPLKKIYNLPLFNENLLLGGDCLPLLLPVLGVSWFTPIGGRGWLCDMTTGISTSDNLTRFAVDALWLVGEEDGRVVCRDPGLIHKQTIWNTFKKQYIPNSGFNADGRVVWCDPGLINKQSIWKLEMCP
jgi:hypothetical protein